VLAEGAAMATVGVVAGAAGGWALARVAASYIQNMQVPGLVPIVGSAMVLLAAAVIASVVPAARAARVGVISALRVE
jgi:putative ABC transport system permease protein